LTQTLTRWRRVAVQRHAIATFNVLNAEDRGVVAALLCETPLTRDEAVFYDTPKPPSPEKA
jgi:hypothetical protein